MSEEEAKEMIAKCLHWIASWWQENTSGVPNTVSDLQTPDYELSKDENYRIAINDDVKKH